jgi:hypothetical protein
MVSQQPPCKNRLHEKNLLAPEQLSTDGGGYCTRTVTLMLWFDESSLTANSKDEINQTICLAQHPQGTWPLRSKTGQTELSFGHSSHPRFLLSLAASIKLDVI